MLMNQDKSAEQNSLHFHRDRFTNNATTAEWAEAGRTVSKDTLLAWIRHAMWMGRKMLKL